LEVFADRRGVSGHRVRAPPASRPITTAGGLVFIGATLDPYFRAYDLKNRRELWKAALPVGGKATPMTYLGSDGRQYVVIAAGGDGKAWGWSDQVIAFALPRPAR
jgi:quinoprotein glucose dehydrogenase